MAKVEMVNFASPTSGSEQTVSLSKITGTPKAAVFVTSTLLSATTGADLMLGFGFSDGTTNRAITVHDDDTDSPTDCNRRHSAMACGALAQTAVLEDFSCAFSAGDLDLTYGTTWGGAALYSALVFDCEAAAVVEQAAGSSTGLIDVTGAGMRPDGAIIIGIGNNNALPNTNTAARFSIGFVNRRGQQVCLAGGAADNVATTNTRASLWDNRCIVRYNNTPSSGSVEEFSFVGFTADGCRLNCTKASADTRWFFLFLKGIDIGIQTFAQPTSTGVQYVTGARPRPQAGVVLGIHGGSLNNATAGVFSSSVGFFDDEATQRCAVQAVSNGQAASSSNRLREWDDDEIVNIVNGTGSVENEGNLSSVLSDGAALDWTTADATARWNALITFGDIESGRRGMTSTRGDCWRCRDLNRLKV